MSRTVITYYEAADGTEPDITVVVEQLDRFTVDVIGLDDLGVPESEQRGVRERATELYWAAERSAYLQSCPPDAD